jgi:hypothetical protein
MDNGGPRRRRALLWVMAGLVLVLVAGVVAYILLRDEHDEQLARATMAEVEAPGPEWDAVREIADQPDERAQYVVSWHLRVKPGEDEAACDQVVAWLTATAEVLPGERASDDDREPDEARARKQCLRALDTKQGTAGSNSFAPWPMTEDGGYYFGTGLVLRYAGKERRDLSAHAEARATP